MKVKASAKSGSAPLNCDITNVLFFTVQEKVRASTSMLDSLPEEETELECVEELEQATLKVY